MTEITSREHIELNNNASETVKRKEYNSSNSSSDLSDDLDTSIIQDSETKDHQDSYAEEEPDVRRFRSMSDGAAAIPNENGDSFEVFPSLPNSVLEKMGLLGDNPRERLNDEEIEQKFVSLSLAFTIDAATIKDRCERQRRYRDQTEVNLNKEIDKLIEKVNRLQPLCVDAETTELLAALLAQVDIIIRATALAAISAERFGAVQHEERLADSVQLMINHVNQLKQQRDQARIQLQYTKRVLQDTNSTEQQNSRQRTHVNGKSMTRRRASIATISQPLPEILSRPVATDSRRMARRTSELSLRGSVLARTTRPARLELGVDLDKIREGKIENIIPPVVAEENEEIEEEISPMCDEQIHCPLEDISNSQCSEIIDDILPTQFRDKIVYRAKKCGRYVERTLTNWYNSEAPSEVFCFCALMCLSLSLIVMGNVLFELECGKTGGLFCFTNIGTFWDNNIDEDYTTIK